MKKLVLFLFALLICGFGIAQTQVKSQAVKGTKIRPASSFGLDDRSPVVKMTKGITPRGGTSIEPNESKPVFTPSFGVGNGDPQPDLVSVWALPSNGGTSTNSRNPSNGYKYQRTWYLITPAELAASGFPSGQTVDAIGYTLAAAGTGTLAGTLNIYMKNTSDATFLISPPTTWNISTFTQVASIANWTVPIALGTYTIPFSGGSPFIYTGGGVYVAWEFGSPTGTVGTVLNTADCNTSLTNGLYGGRGATAWPSLAASNWRPATQFINNTFVDVFQVTNIYAQEKCPIPYGVPTGLTARVVNVSASAQTFNVTMTITDQATSAVRYTNTQTVTALAAGAASIVTFPAWTAANQENDNITVTIPTGSGETFTANNTKVIPVNINNNLFGYCYALNVSTGYGFTYNGTGGIFASKFHMNGTGTIPSANLFIYNYAANAGNTIYAVVINSAGTIVGQSTNLVIAAGDLGTNKNFTFSSQPSFSNEDFYVGLAQPTGGTVQWYPMGSMSESPYRANTFYTFAITGGTPAIQGTDYKFMIEAEVGPPPSVANPSAFATTVVSSSEIDLDWVLNANGNNVLLAWSDDGTFGTPSGSVYNPNDVIAGGGTVLQFDNSIFYNHTGLDPNKTYYYKAWSYNGSIYSPGTTASATTPCAETPAPWTEDFELTTFPPTCWDQAAGSGLWTRSGAASGYMTGTGSAFANFFTISGTVPFALFSLPFNNGTLTSMKLSFDYSYATYVDEVDEMDIYYSTDGGATFLLLEEMPGGLTGILNTAGATTSSFVPTTAAQWQTHEIALPSGTNMVAFNAISAYGNNLYLDNVKVIQGLTHDVGVSALDPRDVLPTGTLPVATIRNYGGSSETFDVKMEIGTYTSVVNVTIGAGLTQLVTFAPLTVPVGDYTSKVTTMLGTDENTANDVAGKPVKVMVLDKLVYGYTTYTTTDQGPIKFNLNNPGAITEIANNYPLTFAAGGTWANDTWYATIYATAAPYNLVKFDIVTGARTIVGDMGVNINALSYNTANSTMYGAGFDGTNSLLYTINLTTGAATLVGTMGTQLIINMAINDAGACYGTDLSADNLGTIDLTTGAFTVIGSIGFDANYAQDMEFDRETGELYMAAYGTTGQLRWVNQATGNTLLIGEFQGGAEVTGFAIPYTSAPTTKTLNLKVYLEGLCMDRDLGSGLEPPAAGEMFSALNDMGEPNFGTGIADKVTVELHDVANYNDPPVATFPDVELSTAGNISITGISALINGTYYITIKHHNSIETTSADGGVSFTGSIINYDFSTAASQAYGDNLKSIHSVFAIFGGNPNQDPIGDNQLLVDSGDMNDVENASALITFGYVVTDCNGDGIVDSGDMNMVENNSAGLVGVVTP